ncbi:hypothetical protein K438DRAFT_1777253 [Mycena galopus ATCC 62051]|nr:hypothetical protein K438DRAFT_1777253 [Mycena galopus ATCC 62051]
MSEFNSTLSQPQQTKLKSRASAQLRKAQCRVSLHKYAESHPDTLRVKTHERMKRKYREIYGTRSYHDFYQPICKFFGDGHLTGITLVDETRLPRKKSFALKITEEHKLAKRKFREGRRVKITITGESIAA